MVTNCLWPAGYGMSSGPSAPRKKPTSVTPTSSSRQPLRAVHAHSSLPASYHSSNQIRFYNHGEPYYEFTNFYPTNVFIDGQYWPTTEHYFQAQKFVGTPYVEKIRKLPTPRDAFQLSRDPLVSRWRRSDWESVKDDIMLKALRVKFSKCVALRDKLCSTGEKELVEHTSNDSYWGDGGDGSGQNKLGKLLMQVRRELKEKHSPGTSSSSSFYHFNTRDDSSIPHHRPPSPRLKRSNSMTNISRSSFSSTSSFLPGGGTTTGSGHNRLYYSSVVGQTGKTPPKQGASSHVASPKNKRRHSTATSTNLAQKATSTAKKTVGNIKQGLTVINHKTVKFTGSQKTKI